MNELPRLAICLLTYKRTEYALRTIEALTSNLIYPKELLGWYVADDGSNFDHVDKILNLLVSKKENVIGYHNNKYSPKTGQGWNKGLGICYQYSDYVLVMEDDWVLSGDFDMNPQNHPGKFEINPYIKDGKLDISPFIEMLSQREDVGMVRLGGLAVGNEVEIVGHNGHHYLKYLKTRPYAFSGNPHIRHSRFIKSYGWYANEEFTPGELETEYDYRFRVTEGPDIWRPSDIPGWGIFHHIGEVNYHS